VRNERVGGIAKIEASALAAMIALTLMGCATIESIISPPPPPPARKEPAVPVVPKKEPETLPAKKEPETAPVKKEPPPPPPARKEPAAAPTKKEPESPPPKKESETPPAMKEPEVSPPVLAPQVGDEEQLKREAGSRIQRTEQLIGQLEDKKLSGEQRERLITIQSLLGNAKEALATRDLARASNLADKARVLAEELASGIR